MLFLFIVVVVSIWHNGLKQQDEAFDTLNDSVCNLSGSLMCTV